MQIIMGINIDNKDISPFLRGLRKRKILLIISFLILFASCKQKTFDSEKELFTYLKNEDNGYQHKRTIGNVSYVFTYRPTDVLVKQELGKKYSQGLVDSLRKKYNNYLYFNLSMSANNQELLNKRVGNRNEFGAMVNQLAFGMGDKVHLISKKRDTIPLVDYVYPRMYGLSKSTDILLVYPRDKKLLKEDYFHFTVEDLGLATGKVTFKLLSRKLISEPQFNLEK